LSTGELQEPWTSRAPVASADPRAVAFGLEAKSKNKTDVAVVRQMRRAIEAAG
ncbi:copper homeostasis protein CutC, partial [Rhizobium leguminosarum]